MSRFSWRQMLKLSSIIYPQTEQRRFSTAHGCGMRQKKRKKNENKSELINLSKSYFMSSRLFVIKTSLIMISEIDGHLAEIVMRLCFVWSLSPQKDA